MPDRAPEDIIADLALRSRRARPVLVIGLLIIFASLLGSVIYLNILLNRSRAAEHEAHRLEADARMRAVRSESDANQLRATLAAARTALEARDIGRTADLLDAAIERTDDLADRAVSATTVPVAPPSEAGTGGQPSPKSAGPQSSATTPVPQFSIRPPGQARSQIVYIQFAGLIRRETIVGLNRALREAGWRAQGGDRGGERTTAAAGYNEVRCATEDDCAAAAELAAAVSGTNIGGRQLRVQRAPVRPGTLEIYVSN